jgi:hypothetical protein
MVLNTIKIKIKDMIIDGSNDDIEASEIVENYYSDTLIICNSIL